MENGKHEGFVCGMAGGGLGAGLLFIGLGVMFWQGIPFWPWILVVVGLASFPGHVAGKNLWAALQGLVWLVGLAVLFATGLFWPGILILIGISMIAGALSRPPVFEGKRKRDQFFDGEKPKRDLPV